jgi:hypothetical protein
MSNCTANPDVDRYDRRSYFGISGTGNPEILSRICTANPDVQIYVEHEYHVNTMIVSTYGSALESPFHVSVSDFLLT